MVLVTTARLLITHTFSELLHGWNLNNVLVCLDDLPDNVLTVFQYNGETIKIKNALRVQVVGHAIISTWCKDIEIPAFILLIEFVMKSKKN